ncbi:alpha-defensin 3-like [Cricetulus griseus]|uniref:Alpha-defensin 3-like n=1 Tax=Cricetulus griseus TaxID=10029 RepID=A0A9J7J305_CRIGR|nr:alpha-defensin 3-like [Cricetulus griseus]XP_027245456.2 alpha-defensin 3-like [Cricetulus griseus]
MKTLVLLSALVLLAFQALADPLPEANEEAKNEEQPGVEDQDVSISFGDPDVSVFPGQAAPSRACSCRKKSCRRSERVSGICKPGPFPAVLCCL